MGEVRALVALQFQAEGGSAFRFSVDAEAGKHITGKGDAEALADTWRGEIRAGTFRRRSEAPEAPVAKPDVLTLAQFGERYFERLGKPASANSQTCFRQWAATPIGGVSFGERARSGAEGKRLPPALPLLPQTSSHSRRSATRTSSAAESR